MAIKLGQRSYQDVAAEVEQCLVDVETAAAASTRPEDVDRAWIDDFVVRTYGREVAA